MKIAVLSDIHSNIFALEAVLEHAAASEVERYINLGDILYGPIAPRATYERLQALEAVTIRGNQDRQIYEAKAPEIAANNNLQFILQDLPQEALSWMQNLPFDQLYNDDIALCHGSPSSDLYYLLEDVSSGVPLVRQADEIQAQIGEQPEILLCGHTHIPRLVEVQGTKIINPGSVGLPAYRDEEPCLHAMENFSPHARYAILEKNHNNYSVNFIAVEYDYEAAAQAAEKRQAHNWAYALRTGRALSEA
jgi:predicted phosphodiesterase